MNRLSKPMIRNTPENLAIKTPYNQLKQFCMNQAAIAVQVLGIKSLQSRGLLFTGLGF